MGLQYYKTEVENKDMYDGKRDINNKAVFIEDRWQFADSWQLNTGLRFDHHSKYGGELTPHIAVNKKLTKIVMLIFSGAEFLMHLLLMSYILSMRQWVLGIQILHQRRDRL